LTVLTTGEMSASGMDAKYYDVSYDGRYWGMSGPDADIVELVLMTPSGCHQLWG
jgi:hypothetical protein